MPTLAPTVTRHPPRRAPLLAPRRWALRLTLGRWASGLALCTAVACVAQSSAPTGTLLLSATGRGTQNYRCTLAGGTASWTLDHPDAQLFNQAGQPVGRHFAGPTWQYKDGSEVVGAVLSKHPGFHPGDVPALELRAIAHHGTGLFARVAIIRRTSTHGGAAPSTGCTKPPDAGKTLAVPYTARYSFYAAP